jgi:hypothetical protein
MARSSPDDDDRDYDDARPLPPQGGGGGTAVKIIAIIAGALLLVFFACTGLVVYGCYSLKKAGENFISDVEKRQKELEKSDKRAASKFGESFIQELKAKRYDAAYKMTSADYQKGTTRKDFETFVVKNQEALTGFGSFQEDFLAPESGSTFVLTKLGQGNPKMTVIKDGNSWKVDKLTVGP